MSRRRSDRRTGEDDSRDLLEPLLLRELTKMVSRQATDIRKALDSKDAAAFSTWLETRYKSVPEWLADICGAALNAVYRARGEHSTRQSARSSGAGRTPSSASGKSRKQCG